MQARPGIGTRIARASVGKATSPVWRAFSALGLVVSFTALLVGTFTPHDLVLTPSAAVMTGYFVYSLVRKGSSGKASREARKAIPESIAA